MDECPLTCGLSLKVPTTPCNSTRRTMLCWLLENLGLARRRTPRGSSPSLPWWQLPQERRCRRRSLEEQLVATDPNLESYGNAIRQETIIHLDSESPSESISQHQESLRVATLSPTCLKSPILLKSRRLSVISTSSTNSSNPMVMVSVTVVSLPRQNHCCLH